MAGIRWLTILVLLTSISACGFHLRGSQPIPTALQTLDLKIEQLPLDWQNAVQDRFQQARINNTSDATYELMLTDLSQTRRVASYNERAKAAEYELISEVRVILRNKQSNEEVLNRVVAARRTYRYDETRVAAKSEEQTVIQTELKTELIRQILNQLNWVKLS